MKKELLIASAVLAALVMTGCGSGTRKAAKEESAEAKAVAVKAERAITQDVAQTAVFTANLQSNKQTFIVPALAARIDKIHVEVGDKVRKGQLLVDMDKNQFNQTIVQLENAEANLERMKAVYETGGISQQQMDELNTSIVVLRENVNNLKTNLELRSPIDGIVTGRYNEVGDLFTMSPNADGGVGILQVMQMDKLKAYVGVSEQYFTQVYMGMPITVTTDVYPGQEFNGKVSRIAPSVNPRTRTFEVEITVDNPSLTLRPGMFARTTFNMGEIHSVTVMDLSVQRQTGTNDKYVFVIEDGKAIRRIVNTGRQVNDRIEILSGVNAGDMVITAGMSKLVNGTEIEVVQ